MARQIETETLRMWLDRQQPVTVLDIRTDEDREQWAIPGSIHVNAYDALRAGEPLADPSVRVIQIRRTGKGCLSYVIASGGEAAVIDASVAPQVYLEIIRRHGWSLKYVIETHVHADHLSRARELVRQTGAALLLPQQHRVTFAFTAVADGERLMLGQAGLLAMRTPGHTDESTSYVLNDAAVFTGDTLFTNGVGRPDLHADAAAARQRARALYASLTRVRTLAPALMVLPGHTSEPVAFDGRPVAATLAAIDGWLSGWLVSDVAFVERVTSQLPPTPPNFVRIVGLNEAGECPADDAIELEAGANRCAIK